VIRIRAQEALVRSQVGSVFQVNSQSVGLGGADREPAW